MRFASRFAERVLKGGRMAGLRRMAMKNVMTLDRLDAQTALELPDREMLLVTIVVTNVLNNLSVRIPIKNNNVAVQVCAAVDVISSELLTVDGLSCDIQQR